MRSKKLRPIRYGASKILDKIGINSFRLDLPSYMNMYTVVNVENLNLYEPPMIMDGEDGIQIPIVDYFSLDYLESWTSYRKTWFLTEE